MCGASGQWEPPSCTAEGDCSPGAAQTTTCGYCGKQERTCGDKCVWSPWGACMSLGVCAPGSKKCCPPGNAYSATCTDECQWGPCLAIQLCQ